MLGNLNVCDICVFIVNVKFSFVSITMIVVNVLTLLYIFAKLFNDSYLQFVFPFFYCSISPPLMLINNGFIITK